MRVAPSQARPHRLPSVKARAPQAALLGRSGDPAADFETANGRLAVSRDPDQARMLLGDLESAFEALRKAGGRDMSGYQNRLDAARRRVAALPVLYGLPDIPRPATTRNPESSAEGATHAQAVRARALMAGYEAGRAAGVVQWLSRFLPFLDRALVTPAFDKLSAKDQARFLAVAKAADGAGQIALHDMLEAGRLSPGLLDGLAKLAESPVDRGVDREKLLSEALVEIHDPVTISQASRGTCSTTSVQILVAREAPETYVRLLAGLASPVGEAELPGGATIRREPDWDASNDGGRSLPSRLLQPAFMELANGDLDYLNAEDMDRDPKTGKKALSGLTAEQAASLLGQTGLEAKGFETHGIVYAPDLADEVATGLDETIQDARDMLMVLQNGKVIDGAGQDQLMADIKAQASPERPVYTTVIYTLYPERGRVGFHALLVTGVKDGFVDYINPWGQEERLPEQQFRTTILSANLGK